MRSFLRRLSARLSRLIGRDLPPKPGPREIRQAATDRADATPEERSEAEAAAERVLDRYRRE